MGSQKIVTIIDEDIGIVELSPITQNIRFNDGVRLIFGTDSDAYFVWNNTAQKFELWVKDRKRVDWG